MKVPGWLLIALAVVVVGLYVRGNVFRGQAVQNALRSDSLEAAADTTRRVFQNDHVRQERRIVQAELKRDSLDKQLKRTTALLANVKAEVKPLTDVAVLPAEPEVVNGMTQVGFRADRPPYHLTETAFLPLNHRIDSIRVDTIRLDPALIQMRTQCGQPVNNVRPATLMFSGPNWLEFTVQSAQQDPLYCNASLMKRVHSGGYYVVRGGLLVGVLVLLSSVAF